VSSRIKFREAIQENEGGDPTALSSWLGTSFVVNEDAIRKPLGDMVKDELTFVADSYGRTATSAAFEEAWFRAIAKRVGSRTVGEVYTEDQLVTMRNSINAVIGR
jgi:hypothetical protein